MKYKISEYARLNRVTVRTVWNWISQNKIHAEKLSCGWRVIEEEHKMHSYAIYARVSSSENKSNLKRQEQRLLDFCAAKGWKVDKVVSEIGSGLNDERPKLEKILLDKSITHIVVEHKDRLARFGTNYIEKLMMLDDREIVVINESKDSVDDLMTDFVSIITSFTSRLYGKRRSKRYTEKLISELENDKS